MHLLLSEHDLGEDDIYDCVPCEDDGDDIYEDIIKVEVRQPMVRTVGIIVIVFLSSLPHKFYRITFTMCCLTITIVLSYRTVCDSLMIYLPVLLCFPHAADQIHAGE